MDDVKTLGQVAFEAYRREVRVAFNGDPIPEWDKLDNGAPARRGWEAAAQAVREHVRMIAALDRGIEMAAVKGAAVTMKPSRWVPATIDYPALSEPEPEFSAPIGRGEAPDEALVTDANRVPVEVEPDVDAPRCKCIDECGHRG